MGETESVAWKWAWHPLVEFPDSKSVFLPGIRIGPLEHRLPSDLVRRLGDEGMAADDRNGEREFELSRPVLHRMRKLRLKGLLCLCLTVRDGGRIEWLDGDWDSFSPPPVAPESNPVAVKGAYLRFERDGFWVEAPGVRSRLRVTDSEAASVLAGLLAGRREADAGGPEEALAGLAAAAGFLVSRAGKGRIEKKDSIEWHDRLFHWNWRWGNHRRPVGATYPGKERGEKPPPALPPEAALTGLSLPRFDPSRRPCPPLDRVLRERRSVRRHGPGGLSIEALGAFLELAVAQRPAAPMEFPEGTLELLRRPYPSGGGLHELDLFLNIRSGGEVPSGYFYYNPQTHVLARRDVPEKTRLGLLLDAEGASAFSGRAAVQILIFSRLQRLAWKYRSMAYAITLQNCGALYQTLSLAATALGLASCVIGNGNEDRLRKNPGLAGEGRWWVGNFLLGLRPEGPDDDTS